MPGGIRLYELARLHRRRMSNPSRRETRVRLVTTIHQEIEKTNCRPRPRLATQDGSEPRRGLGPTTKPRQRSAGRAHGDLTSWEHCFNDNCKEHRWEKVDAGYYPRQVGEKGTLAKNESRENKKWRVVRTRLGGEESEKKVVPEVETLEKTISDL